MTSAEIVLLSSVALVAGVANSIAGGGSFLTFPSLLFVGLQPVNANATNTVAVWPGILASTSAYRKSLGLPVLRFALPLIIVTLIGSILGAWLLLHTPQITFMKMVPWLLLGGTVLFIFGPRISRWETAPAPTRGQATPVRTMCVRRL